MLINAETRRFELAAHWADLHPGGSVPEVNCLWRSPPTHLRHKPDGTHPLGDTQFAQKIWQRNIGGSRAAANADASPRSLMTAASDQLGSPPTSAAAVEYPTMLLPQTPQARQDDFGEGVGNRCGHTSG